MKNIALIHYYVLLIQKKVMKLNEIPDDIKPYVEKYLNGEEINNSANQDENKKEIKEESKLGAIYIEPITRPLPYDINDHKEFNIKLPFIVNDIFTKSFLDGRPIPENCEFKLALYEKQFNDPLSNIDVSIVNNILSIKGNVSIDFSSNTNFLRFDIIMESSNYEPMRIVYYLNTR